MSVPATIRGMRRKKALSSPCPKCGAAIGDPCIGMRSPRQPRRSPHIQRHKPEEAARRKKHGCQKTTWLYVIGEKGKAGPVKVGISRSPANRLSALQVGAYGELTIYAKFPFNNRAKAIKAERSFHHAMAEGMVRGEWFCLTPDEAQTYIKSYLKDTAA